MRRRRRFFRDDVVAPWLTLLVVVGLWWVGAKFFGPASATVPATTLSGTAAAKASTEAAPPAPLAPRVQRDVAKTSAESPAIGPVPAAHGGAVLTREPRDGGEIELLRDRQLAVPVEGVTSEQIVSNFDQQRGGGRKHEALDILAPRGTPVVAADDGRVAKLFNSAAGGITLYQFDPAERYTYYYAHLDRYASGIDEGDFLKRGQVLGYVGTTGNAPPGTPHLHFAIFKLGPDKRWWEGAPLDPALVLK